MADQPPPQPLQPTPPQPTTGSAPSIPAAPAPSPPRLQSPVTSFTPSQTPIPAVSAAAPAVPTTPAATAATAAATATAATTASVAAAAAATAATAAAAVAAAATVPVAPSTPASTAPSVSTAPFASTAPSASASASASTTHPAPVSASHPPKPQARRGWTKLDLIKGGISSSLISTLENFTNDIPPIQNQIDHGKKTQNRDMRGWINKLQQSDYTYLWDSLVNTLRSDSTAESVWGAVWDRHLCRYILGIVVSKDKTAPNPDGRSQSRQAVNNAIKRELDCHFEPKKTNNHKSKSARSKTFRDLFREKCRKAGVPVPPYELESRDITQVAQTPAPDTVPPVSIPANSSISRSTASHFTDITNAAIRGPNSTPGSNSSLMTTTTIEDHRMASMGNAFGTVSNIQTLSQPLTTDPSSFQQFELAPSIYHHPLKPYESLAPSREMFPVTLRSSHGPPETLAPTADSNQERGARLQLFRSRCFSKHGRTEWWTLQDLVYLREVPRLLFDMSLYELLALLLDFRWIMRTFQTVDYNTGMRQVPTEGYDILIDGISEDDEEVPAVEREGYRLIRNAIMFTLAIVKDDVSAAAKNPSFFAHVATQITGRLLPLKRRFPNIAQLLRSIEIHAPRPWLRPLSRCLLPPPKTDVKLVVPSDGTRTPYIIVLSEDGKVLVTAGSTSKRKELGPKSSDTKINMIRIWDVETGKLLLENKDVPEFIDCLALSRDNTRISFKTVKGLTFWHLKSSEDRTTISKEKQNTSYNDVETITPTGNNEYVLTTHRCIDAKNHIKVEDQSQPRIALWNTTEGSFERGYLSVASVAKCLDVSPDGKFFVSGHENGFIHLWSLDEGAEDQPILSFLGAIEKPGQKPVSSLALANARSTPMGKNHTVASVCYHEKGSSKLVTASLRDNKVRVWELPPMALTNSKENTMRAFMTTICRAVISKQKITQVQWSENKMYTCGEYSEVPCEWEHPEDDWTKDWKWYSIDRVHQLNPERLWISYISVGRRCNYVASYSSKSPYVTVWDMSRRQSFGQGTASTAAPSVGWKKFNSIAYRRHSPFDREGKDAIDMEDSELIVLKPKSDRARLQEQDPPMKHKGNEDNLRQGLKMPNSDEDVTQDDLSHYFKLLNDKFTTRKVGPSNPRLTMSVSEGQTLEMCFERPVVMCESGDFVEITFPPLGSDVVSGCSLTFDQGDENGALLEGRVTSEENAPKAVVRGGEAAQGDVAVNQPRKGMAVYLGGGLVALFELESRGPNGGAHIPMAHVKKELFLSQDDRMEVDVPKVNGVNNVNMGMMIETAKTTGTDLLKKDDGTNQTDTVRVGTGDKPKSGTEEQVGSLANEAGMVEEGARHDEAGNNFDGAGHKTKKRKISDVSTGPAIVVNGNSIDKVAISGPGSTAGGTNESSTIDRMPVDARVLGSSEHVYAVGAGVVNVDVAATTIHPTATSAATAAALGVGATVGAQPAADAHGSGVEAVRVMPVEGSSEQSTQGKQAGVSTPGSSSTQPQVQPQASAQSQGQPKGNSQQPSGTDNGRGDEMDSDNGQMASTDAASALQSPTKIVS